MYTVGLDFHFSGAKEISSSLGALDVSGMEREGEHSTLPLIVPRQAFSQIYLPLPLIREIQERD